MAFGNIDTFYLPVTASAGVSQWGTDVRKLLDAADVTADALTKTNHGTGTGASVRTADPFTTTTGDLDQALYGFAITPADMNSVSGAKRMFPAGDHTMTWRVSQNAALAVTPTHTLSIYRVGDAAGGRVRTLLGSASGGQNVPGSSGESTQTVTVALGEVVFEPDETVQYSWETSCTGVVVSGRILTHYTGVQSSVESKIVTPGLKTLADATGAASGAATASGTTGKVLGATGSAAGAGSASGVGGAYSGTVGEIRSGGEASGVMSSVYGTVGAASGVGAATGAMSSVLGAVGTVSIGGGGAPEDYSPNDGLKAIADVVRHHETGALVAGATVKLVRDSDEFHAASTTSGADGAYSFARDTNDPHTYHVYVYYTDGATKIQGVSERGLVPA